MLQECVPPVDFDRSQIIHRHIAGSRPWGSAVAAFNSELRVQEIDSVRTKYGAMLFPMIGTYPGATMVARIDIPDIGPITFVSVYGLINVYAQTTMLRIVADLIPLFDSSDGERVLLGGDFNVGTSVDPRHPELQRYEAIIKAVESLGLRNLAETAADPPPRLNDCPCGASACRHLRTHRNTQLDWMFATPQLAVRCQRLRVEGDDTVSLSDHAPIVADFDIPLGNPDRRWDPGTFVQEVGVRHGANSRKVAEEIIDWAQRKHEQISTHNRNAALHRLPTSKGPDPKLWVQLDLRNPVRLGWTISMGAHGAITLQFKHMTAPPFDGIEARKRMYEAIVALPGVKLDERLTGLPSFPMSALATGDNLKRFIQILEDAVDQMVEDHNRSATN